MVTRFHAIGISDGVSIPRELQVFSELSMRLPPESFIVHHGGDGGIGVGKPHSLDTVLRIWFAMCILQIFVGAVAPTVAELSRTDGTGSSITAESTRSSSDRCCRPASCSTTSPSTTGEASSPVRG
jgi:hypothetical protein